MGLNIFKNAKRGLTILELLISISVFGVLVAMSTGAFVTVLKSQRQALSGAQVQGNASVVMDVMTREIRTSKNFSVPGGISCGLPSTCFQGQVLSFTDNKGQNIVYSLSGQTIQRQVNSGAPESITAANVNVVQLSFSLQWAGVGDGRQPLITVMASIVGVGPKPEQNIRIDVQTSLSSRELEL